MLLLLQLPLVVWRSGGVVRYEMLYVWGPASSGIGDPSSVCNQAIISDVYVCRRHSLQLVVTCGQRLRTIWIFHAQELLYFVLVLSPFLDLCAGPLYPHS